MRMLSGILAGQDFASELIGTNRFRAADARIITPLAAMGARITAGRRASAPAGRRRRAQGD